MTDRAQRTAAEDIVRYEKDRASRIATITLDRPEALNAPTIAARRRFADLVLRANIDDDVKVLVIRGVGEHFGSGADLPEMAGMFDPAQADYSVLPEFGLADDASMASEFSWFTAPDHPLQLLLPEQSIRVRVENVWMLRILDVAAALQARGWPAGLRGELHLEIEDELLPENAGRWVLEVADGQARVRRGGEGHLRGHIRALASLYSGHRSASELASVGWVTGSSASINTADALFAARMPSMPDMF